MSEDKTLKTNLTRRGFLKATAGVAGATALTGAAGATLAGCAATTGDTPLGSTGEEQVFAGVCRGNCAGGCFLNVHVRDGRVVRTSARDLPNNDYKRICSKGLTHMYRMYGEHRVRYPMKRVGERGDIGSFERVGWDEVLSEIAEKWRDLLDKYGQTAMAFYWGSGQFGTANGCRYNDIWNRFANVLGMAKINRSVDMAQTSLVYALGAGAMSAQNEPADFKNSKTLFVWGANPAISQIHTSHFILEAQRDGTKLVVIDPVYNTFASKADIHVPIKAGTDGALALGMARLIIENGWYDEDFMKAYTNAPFLVKSSDGKLLRQSDLGITIPADAEDEVIVCGSDGSVGTLAEVANPVLDGRFNVEGHDVTVVFALVKENCEPYTLEYTSEITGVKPEMIEEITDLYCNEGPSNIYTAFGPNHYTNGHTSFACMALMPMLSGNIGGPGMGCGLNELHYIKGNPALGNPEGAQGISLDVTNLVMGEIMDTGKLNGQDAIIKGCLIVGCNPLTNGTERNHIRDWLGKMEMIVCVDQSFNETALFSDYILPAAHWFEEEDIFCLFAAHPFVLHQEKAVDPSFESRTDFEIASSLGRALGYDEYFTMTDNEYLRKWFEDPMVAQTGLTYETLASEGAFNILPTSPYVFADGRSFPMGELKFYLEQFNIIGGYNWGQDVDFEKEHLAHYETPNEVKDDQELRGRFPFHLYSDHSRFHTHSQWWDVDPLVELVGGEPTLKINPEDAAEHGIDNGDMVRVYNDRGDMVIRAFLNPGLPRTMLSAPKGWDISQHVKGHMSNLTSRVINPACVNACFNDVVVEIEKL